jgi:hypothetical protein
MQGATKPPLQAFPPFPLQTVPSPAEDGSPFLQRDAAGRTLLHHAALAADAAARIGQYIDTLHMDVDWADYKGVTPLMYALQENKTCQVAVHALVAHGACVRRVDSFGRDALYFAVKHGHDWFIPQCMQLGCNPLQERDKCNLLIEASRNSKPASTLRILLDESPALRDLLHTSAQLGGTSSVVHCLCLQINPWPSNADALVEALGVLLDAGVALESCPVEMKRASGDNRLTRCMHTALECNSVKLMKVLQRGMPQFGRHPESVQHAIENWIPLISKTVSGTTAAQRLDVLVLGTEVLVTGNCDMAMKTHPSSNIFSSFFTAALLDRFAVDDDLVDPLETCLTVGRDRVRGRESMDLVSRATLFETLVVLILSIALQQARISPSWDALKLPGFRSAFQRLLDACAHSSVDCLALRLSVLLPARSIWGFTLSVRLVTGRSTAPTTSWYVGAAIMRCVWVEPLPCVWRWLWRRATGCLGHNGCVIVRTGTRVCPLKCAPVKCLVSSFASDSAQFVPILWLWETVRRACNEGARYHSVGYVT